MDDYQDHAEDPDRRMTQDLDTPEVRGPGGAAMAAPCPQQKGADEDRDVPVTKAIAPTMRTMVLRS
jgi:hypothetical protein